MTTARVTITLPTELRQSVQAVADRAGVPFSAVVSSALAAWVRGQLVDAWLAEHQAAYGAFDEGELRTLAREAGVAYVPADRARRVA